MTNEQKHTPGPWIYASGNDCLITIDAPPSSTGYDESMEICLMSTQDNDALQANSVLIARAPELLAENEVLRAQNAELVRALKEQLAESEAYEENGTRFDKERNDRARAALAQVRK